MPTPHYLPPGITERMLRTITDIWTVRARLAPPAPNNEDLRIAYLEKKLNPNPNQEFGEKLRRRHRQHLIRVEFYGVQLKLTNESSTHLRVLSIMAPILTGMARKNIEQGAATAMEDLRKRYNAEMVALSERYKGKHSSLFDFVDSHGFLVSPRGWAAERVKEEVRVSTTATRR